MKSIFEFRDYKAYLTDYEDSRRSLEKGFRSKLAAFVGCQSGYISHVLNGNSHFSLEQAMRVAAFLKLDKRERKYFFLLIEYARAGTAELQEYFSNELREKREEFLDIKERVGDSRTLSDTEQATYYSGWHYLAVHVLSSLDGFDDKSSIARGLGLPESVVSEVLLFLISAGVVIEEKGKLKPGMTQVHLSRESPLIRQHHTNWRIAAIQSLAADDKRDVHYSTLSTLSKTDAETLRAKMIKLIEEYVATVKPSPEEVMYGFNLDFYKMIKN